MSRTSHMTPEEVITACDAVGGGKALAEAMGVHHVTVYKWRNGTHPVNKQSAKMIKMIVANKGKS